jgi:tetratricopeptide (TPR) repeat protein
VPVPGALTLAPKRALTLAGGGACVRAPAPAAAARRDELAARAEAARARELALVGDRGGARLAFARALALDPASASLAYDLARAAEEAGDPRGALGAYCRYLALAPAGADAPDARARVTRLSGGGAEQAERQARDAFGRGLVALDGGRYAEATALFGDALRSAPSAPEAVYNRGLAALAQGRDADAARDLAAYVASPSAGADRAEVLRAVDALRRPAWDPGAALTRGVLPGFGQFYTGRPALGVAALAAAAAAVGVGLQERATTREAAFVDPFGNPYTSPVTQRRRPYLGAGLGAAALVTVGAALEARSFAARSARGRPSVRVRLAAGPAVGASGQVAAAPAVTVRVAF